MGADGRSVTWLLNPFHFLSGERALPLGLVFIGLTAVASWLTRAHVDGVLDVHRGPSAPLWVFAAEGLVDWLCLGAFASLIGGLVSRSRLRLVDTVGMQALARAPQLLAVGLVAFVDPKCRPALAHLRPTAECGTLKLGLFVLVLALMVPLLVWTVALMYRAFAVACNLSGGRGAASFIASLILAEILSKVLIVVLLRPFIGP